MIGARRVCPQCAAKVSAKARWCPSCGAALPEVERPQAGESRSAAEAVSAAPAQPRKMRLPMSWSIVQVVTATLAALIALTLAACVSVLVRGSNSLLASEHAPGTSERLDSSPSLRADLLKRTTEVTVRAYTMTAATLEKDLAAATATMTPEMAAKYLSAFPADKRKAFVDGHFTYSATVPALGAVWITDKTATFNELLAMTAVVAGSKAKVVTPLQFHITMAKVNGTWLLSGMDPF